jgi:hypothetical protein
MSAMQVESRMVDKNDFSINAIQDAQRRRN